MAFSKRSKVSLISSVMVGRNSSLRTMCSAKGGFALATSSPLGSVPKYATFGKLRPKVVLPVPGPPLTRILNDLGNSAIELILTLLNHGMDDLLELDSLSDLSSNETEDIPR